MPKLVLAVIVLVAAAVAAVVVTGGGDDGRGDGATAIQRTAPPRPAPPGPAEPEPGKGSADPGKAQPGTLAGAEKWLRCAQGAGQRTFVDRAVVRVETPSGRRIAVVHALPSPRSAERFARRERSAARAGRRVAVWGAAASSARRGALLGCLRRA